MFDGSEYKVRPNIVFIITGEIGIGKTTICKKVLEMARKSGFRCGGIITHKMPGDSLSVMDIRSGEMAVLAIPGDKFGGPLVPRFTFDPEGITFGIRAIKTGSLEDILFVDEIGIIETMGKGFIKAFDIISESRTKNSVLVIRNELLEYLLPGLDHEPLIFEATAENRDRLPTDIFNVISRDQASR
jgi:nucleoside-triphosphatase THEP1